MRHSPPDRPHVRDTRRVPARRWRSIAAGFAAVSLVSVPSLINGSGSRGGALREQETARRGDEIVTFALRYRSDGRYDLAHALGSSRTQASPSSPLMSGRLTIAIDGLLEIADVASRNDTLLVRAALRPRFLQIDRGDGSAAAGDQLARDLAIPLVVRMSRDGRVLGFTPTATIGNTARDLWRALLSAQQMIRPDSAATRDEWTVEEEDIVGRYEAVYRKSPHPLAGHLELLKHKRNYANTIAQGSRPIAIDVSSGGLSRGVCDAVRLRCDTLTVIDTTTTRFAGSPAAVVIGTLERTIIARQELADLTRRAMSAEAEASLAQPVIHLLATPSDAEQDSILARSAAGDATWEELAASIRGLDSSSGRASVTTPVYLQLRGYLELHAEAAESLSNLLDSAGSQTASFRTAVGALGSAGTESAQRVLARALRARRYDLDAVRRLTSALAGVDAPTPEAIHALRDVAQDSEARDARTSAILALGSVSRQLRASRAAAADTLSEWLRDRLRRAASPGERRVVLSALGNAAAAAALPDLRLAMSDPEPTTRQAAVYALRWIDAVDSLLASALADREVVVRQAAVSAMAIRQEIGALNPIAVAALRRAAMADASPDVQKAARRLLDAIPQR